MAVDRAGEAFAAVVEVMARLRAPDGCPWDREQTHASLARHLLEETHEALDAIDAGDLDELREELGDLVLQVVFHAEIAAEEDAFDVADVLDELRAKLVRRHPHVFGDVEVADADEVYANWERIKQSEKTERRGTLDGIPSALPALARAAKVYRRAVGVGFSFETTGEVLDDLEAEVAELRAEVVAPSPDASKIEAELGDVLFSAVCVAQRCRIEPEDALRRMLGRFEARFAAVEAKASRDGRPLDQLSLEGWRRYWSEAKDETA